MQQVLIGIILILGLGGWKTEFSLFNNIGLQNKGSFDMVFIDPKSILMFKSAQISKASR